MLLKQSTTRNVTFLMVLTSDHISAATGKTVTVNLSKDGGTFAAAGGTVTEIANGWYKVALTTTDSNTLGDLTFNCTATACDNTDFKEQVVADLPGASVSSVTGAVGSVTGAVGSVTGNVGGNVTGSVGSVVGAVGSVTGNVGGSVASVTGAVASVTGNVGGNVVGSVASVTAGVTVTTNNDKTGYTASTVSDKTGYSLSAGGVQAIWDALTSALTTVGSIGKLIVTNLDAAISSRSTYSGGAVASVTGNVGGNVVGSVASVTAGVTVTTNNDKTGYGLSAAAVQAVWDALTSALTTVGSIGKLIVTNLDAAISSRSTYSGGAVSSVTGNVGGNVVGSVASVTAGVTVTTNNDKTGYTASTVSDKTGYALTAGEHTNIVADVNTALDAAGTELTAVPGAAGTLRQKINMVFQYLIFKRTTTATVETAFKADSTTTLGTSTVSDDATTATHGKVT